MRERPDGGQFRRAVRSTCCSRDAASVPGDELGDETSRPSSTLPKKLTRGSARMWKRFVTDLVPAWSGVRRIGRARGWAGAQARPRARRRRSARGACPRRCPSETASDDAESARGVGGVVPFDGDGFRRGRRGVRRRAPRRAPAERASRRRRGGARRAERPRREPRCREAPEGAHAPHRAAVVAMASGDARGRDRTPVATRCTKAAAKVDRIESLSTGRATD